MERGFTRRRVMQAGALGAGTALLANRLPRVAAQDTPAAGGTLRIGRSGDFLHFDPFFAVTVNLPMYRQLYNTLVTYDAQLNIQPQLAESWEYSEDRLTLTFTLRQGVTFHNGRAFTADDVVQNIQRAQDETLSHSVLGYTRPITEVTAVDPHTVQFAFSEPANAIFDLLTVLGIVAPEAFEAPAITNPIGTGPFAFVEWNPGQEARFQRYDGYWGEELPYLDEVVVRAMPDQQAAVANLEAGELDIIQGVPLNEVPRLQEADGLEIVLGTEASQFYTFYNNTARPPFDNKLVRQAMSHAIDRQTIVDTVLFGVGKASQTPFPEWSLAYNPEHVDWFPFDLDRAKELLAEAGYPDGFEMTLAYNSERPGPFAENLARLIQSDLKAVGITMETQAVPSNTDFEAGVAEGKYESYLYTERPALAEVGYDLFLYLESTSALNTSGYSNPAFDEAAGNVLVTAPGPERDGYVQDAFAELIENDPLVSLVEIPDLVGIAESVEGYHALPTGGWPFQDLKRK